MKTVMLYEPYKVDIIDEPVPDVPPDRFLVKNSVTGISNGTEMRMYRGDVNVLPRWQSIEGEWSYIHEYPTTPGYESVGEVVEVGAEVDDLEVGDRVVSCGQHYEYVLGRKPYGKVPENVSDDEALFAILGTTTAHIMRRANFEYGDNVLVVGQGGLGLLAAQQARNAGAGMVIGADIDDRALAISKKVGVDVQINSKKEDIEDRVYEETDGLGADVAIEATGNPNAVNDAVNAVRAQGKVLIGGWHADPSNVVYGDTFMIKELKLISCMAMGPSEPGLPPHRVRWDINRGFEFQLKLLSEKRLNVKPMITHRFDFTDIAKAYDLIDKRSEFFSMVLLDWKR